jgi:hypothetical protein
MAKRNKLIMASVFEDTRTRSGLVKDTANLFAVESARQGKFMAVDYLQLDLAMSYLCSTFVLF